MAELLENKTRRLHFEKIPILGIRGEDSVPDSQYEEMVFGRDYHAELMINSKGTYTYLCNCGATNFGSLREFSLERTKITCGNYSSDCISFDLARLLGQDPQRDGPRMYIIKISEDGNDDNL